jgi:hypothetical protein
LGSNFQHRWDGKGHFQWAQQCTRRGEVRKRMQCKSYRQWQARHGGVVGKLHHMLQNR